MNLSEARQGTREFATVVRLLMAARGNADEALRLADAQGASPGVKLVLRTGSGINAADGSAGTGPELAIAAGQQAAVFNALINAAVFDAMLPDMTATPANTRIVVVTSAYPAAVTDEAKPVSMRKLAFSSTMTPFSIKKASAMLTMSRELALSPLTDSVVRREMTNGVAVATDTNFVAALISGGGSPISSAGTSAANMLTDANALLAGCALGSFSKPYFVYLPANIKKMIAATSGGLRVFPDLEMPGRGIECGHIFGIPVLCTDGLAAGKAILVDAVQIAADRGSLDVAYSDEADVELDTVPTQVPPTTAAALSSLFQSNLVSARVTRWFGFKPSRSTAIASLSGATY